MIVNINNDNINNDIFINKGVRSMAFKENGRKNFVKLTTAVYILRILEENASHGHCISEQIKERTGQVICPNTNSLYPTLHLLEERGYIMGTWDSPTMRCKRVYKITDAGREYLPELEERLRSRIEEIEQNIKIIKADLLK